MDIIYADLECVTNFNLEDIITLVVPDILEKYLQWSNYDSTESRFLVNGFREGFDIHYEGPQNRCDVARNIPFQVGVGEKFEMWNKMIKEVKERRYCGPFREVPYGRFIQSPIGLVPKAGNKTRLIFHLSYDFPNGNRSVNFHTPPELYTIKYRDIDYAVKLLLMLQKTGIKRIFYSKTDLMSAFRILPLKPSCSR